MTTSENQPGDSRIAASRAALDDARTNLADLIDENPYVDWQVLHWIKEAAKYINKSIDYLGKVQ